MFFRMGIKTFSDSKLYIILIYYNRKNFHTPLLIRKPSSLAEHKRKQAEYKKSVPVPAFLKFYKIKNRAAPS